MDKKKSLIETAATYAAPFLTGDDIPEERGLNHEDAYALYESGLEDVDAFDY